jgi:hypothetical protein
MTYRRRQCSVDSIHLYEQNYSKLVYNLFLHYECRFEQCYYPGPMSYESCFVGSKFDIYLSI